MRGVYDVLSMATRYGGETAFVAIFLLALAYCYVNADGMHKKRYAIIIGLSFILIFNNFVLGAVSWVVGYLVYYRFFWGAPVILLIAYSMVKLISKGGNIAGKSIMILLMALVVLLGGSNVNTLLARVNMPMNRYNIPHDVIEVATIINEDREADTSVIAANLEIMINIRQYDASFIWGVTRATYLNMHAKGPDDPSLSSSRYIIVRAVEFGRQNPENSEALREALNERGIDYIVTHSRFDMDTYFEEVGFVVVGRSGNNTVYGRGLY